MTSRLGKRIKQYREKVGLTQFQLAEKIGVSEFYISALETGRRNPGRKILVKLANEMKVPIEALLDIETDNGLKFTTEELYDKIKNLPTDIQKKIINIIDFIIEEFKK
ncbi:MAG: helix-turn-helix transcriptional regulator [Clostridia bacterium]|nr:helix-turn-helix transcriptional regulator [Clostridia bacterium]